MHYGKRYLVSHEQAQLSHEQVLSLPQFRKLCSRTLMFLRQRKLWKLLDKAMNRSIPAYLPNMPADVDGTAQDLTYKVLEDIHALGGVFSIMDTGALIT